MGIYQPYMPVIVLSFYYMGIEKKREAPTFFILRARSRGLLDTGGWVVVFIGSARRLDAPPCYRRTWPRVPSP